MEPARLLGACKPGSRARMDSRTGVVFIMVNMLNLKKWVGWWWWWWWWISSRSGWLLELLTELIMAPDQTITIGL